MHENDEGNFRAVIKEFGEVDPRFIKFIKNEIQDYDDSKHKNFYVLE